MSTNTLTTFHPKKTTYCLIIGVLDEGERFIKQIELLQPYRHLVDIIIADGGTTDGSTSDEMMRNSVRARVIKKGEGLSGQYRAAISFAMSENYGGIVFMDGNGKDSPESIPFFVEKLQGGFDFIQGSRFMKGGSHRNTPPARTWGIKLIAVPLFWLSSGFRYTDPINGYKACSMQLLQAPGMEIERDIFKNYTLQYYLNYSAPRLSKKIAELPVSRNYPSSGKLVSKIVGFKSNFRVLMQMVKVCFGFYNSSVKKRKDDKTAQKDN